jgi:long-subunit fatty acid transport protein
MRGLIAGALIAVMFVSVVFANGLFIPPCSRASALGNAGVAGTIDTGAIYYNPAELAGLEGSEIQVEPAYSIGKLKSDFSMINAAQSAGHPDPDNGEFPLPNMYPSEPALYGTKEIDITSFLPYVAGYTKVNDITLAIGAYVVGGGMGKFDSTIADGFTGTDLIHAALDSSFGFLVYNVSAGKNIAPGVDLGLGVNLITMQSNAKVNKEYVKGAGSGIGTLTSYNINLENSAAGSGVEGVAGVTYSPTERFKTGFVLRSGTKIALKGTSKYSQSGLGDLGNTLTAATGDPSYAVMLADAQLQSDFDQDYAYPMTAAIGAEYQASEKVDLLVQVDKNWYSALKNDITYKSPVAGVFDNVNRSQNWNDTYQAHAGIEYSCNEKWKLRGGMMTDPLAFTREKASLINTNEFNILVFSVGAGYTLDRVQLDIVYLRTLSDKFDNLGRSFEYASDMFQVGMRYRI